MSLGAQSLGVPKSPAWRSVARSCTGPRRSTNEDAYLERPDIGLWAVADGMGGHQRGEVASGRIVQALSRLADCGSASGLLGAASSAIEAVHRDLVAEARALGPRALIGATVVVLIAAEGRFACMWAGDSRAYRLRAGELEPITRDHSLVQELLDAGALSPGAAKTDPRAHVVTRAVGVAERPRLELAQGSVAAGDVILLCSDGLTGVVTEAEIAGAIDPDAIGASADRLMNLALNRQAPDNVTFVVATFQ